MKTSQQMISLAVATALGLTGCASIHNGNYAKPESAATSGGSPSDSRRTATGLVVSGQEVKELSSKFISQIDFTFENKSSKWIHVKSIKMDFGSAEANNSISFPVGADLEAWMTAAKQNQAIRDYNFNLAVASVAGVGAAVAGGAGSKNQRDAGLYTVAGASTALTVNAIRTELNNLELAKVVPANHIFASNFVIPPGLHAKKWVAIYSEKPYDMPFVDSITLEITMSNNTVEKLKLPFRNGGMTRSPFQLDHPDKGSARWEAFLERKKANYRQLNQTPDLIAIRKEFVKELTTIE